MGKIFHKCSKCKKELLKGMIFVVDGNYICVNCLYGKVKPFQIYPIGIVRNNLKRNKMNFGTTGKKGVSCLKLFPSQKPFLYKIDEEKYLTIVYYLHQAKQIQSVFKRGLDGKEVGIFSSRTPDRLSRIAIQDVALVKVEGTDLHVEGLDAIDGTPVLDIKLKIQGHTPL
ncbi:MAG: SAM-dependent methyltransferase [Candidatus Omnitrophica bacterium]|nr:SAM-dependent methyltransferase [Candidatus Omnitrophota bacterium]